MSEMRRADDVIITELSTKFDDFIERYDRDCGALNEWRRTVDIELKSHGDILREISPAYNRGKWIAGIITLGSIGVAVKAFWSHFKWQ